MSALKDQINSELKQAMLNKDVFVRDTLRLVTSEIKRFEVDNRQDPTNDDVITILKRMAKQRKDSIQQYIDGGRPDLEEIEQKELDLLATYLPQALSGDALKTAISGIISEHGFSGMQDMGKVMGLLKSEGQGRVDMGKASALVKAQLASL